MSREGNARGRVMLEHELKEMLRQRGLPVPVGRLCCSVDEALEAATGNYPVVYKVVADDLLHKTDIGGVRLNIEDEKDVGAVFIEMDRAFRERVAGYRGILVEEMAPPGVEVIVGLQKDPAFGPVIMAGLGGIFTDLFRDVAFRMLPLSAHDALDMLRELRAWPLLAGYRGDEAIDVEALARTIAGIGDLGMELADRYESVDFNPVIVHREGCVIVDATLVSGSPLEHLAESTEPRTVNLEKFFSPRSVAVIGASTTDGKIGNVILDSLINLEFTGETYPVNPNYTEIMGKPCYRDLAALPALPDLVVVVVDLERMPGILDDMHSIGATNALIVSGGGRELGGDRAALEADIARKAAEYGIRIIGPNCIGSFDGHSRFDSFFYHRDRFTRPSGGTMSFITQSGTWGCAFMEAAHRQGIAKMVSYGNRVDVDEGDLIAFLATDDETAVIGSYLEGLGNGRRFLRGVAQAVDTGKPVVVFKTGRTGQAASASVSHTGAYGGSYEVYDGIFAQHGVIATDSFHECLAGCRALAMQPAAPGNRVALVSNGAGPMVNALDLFEKRGLKLATLADTSIQAMREQFSFFYIVSNPVDVTGSATAADYDFVIECLFEDDNVDIIMPFFVFQNTPLDESIVERLDRLNAMKKKPILCCAAGGPYTETMARRLEEVGIPLYPDIIQWTAAAGAMARWHEIVKNKEEKKNG